MIDPRNKHSQVHPSDASCSDFHITVAREDFVEKIRFGDELNQMVNSPDVLSIELLKAMKSGQVRAFLKNIFK